MKHLQKKYVVIAILIATVMGLVYCTKTNQLIEEEVSSSGNELVSVKTTTVPTIDGTIDAMWVNSPKLEFSAVVPEVTGDIYRGYVDNVISSVTLRSAYDADNIYFLAEWVDPTKSLSRELWYFDPATQRWAQESEFPTFNSSGTITRAAFFEDQFGMQWSINNSVLGWNNSTCYKSCHTGLPDTDGSGRHFTNSPTEIIDLWHWKAVRGGTNGGFQIDDQRITNKYPNGRGGDPGNQAYSNNTQNLVITGSSPAITVSVPKYVIPGRTNNYWVLGTEVTAGTAKLVTAVAANGVLTLSDATTIDPNVGTDYQRVGAGVGAKCIASVVITSYTGSRGDISANATHTGSGWILEFKRALKTTDSVNDVDFSSLADQYFGCSIFDNADIAHAIKPNLLLKFQK